MIGVLQEWALRDELQVEDFSESTLGKTARGLRGPNYPQVAFKFSFCRIGFAEKMAAEVIVFTMQT